MTMECLTKEVKFRDGSRLVVSEENWLTGVKLLRLQKAANESEVRYPDLEREYFRLYVYPKLCAAIIEGTPPKEEVTILLPATELDKWYSAVKELNPHWFIEVPDTEEEKKLDEKKRKPRKRK